MENIGHKRACKLLENVDAPGLQVLFDALQCHDRVQLRPQHLTELRKALYCCFSPFVTAICLAPCGLTFQYSFINMRVYSDMGPSDVATAVGLSPLDLATTPSGSTAQDFVVGGVDTAGQR